MIDTHCHILYGVDDGPTTFEETTEMLKKAAAEGITTICATSHFDKGALHVPATIVQQQVANLQQYISAQQLGIRLVAGHEITLNKRTVQKIIDGEALPLGNSRYVLLELPSRHLPSDIDEVLHELQVQGYLPIIAHPERQQMIIKSPQTVMRLIHLGAYTQVTAPSLVGYYGKHVQKTAWQLVAMGAVHFIGSDAHDSTHRTFYMRAAEAAFHQAEKSHNWIEYQHNNYQILCNERVEVPLPQITKRRWWQLR